jgi:hypothetical protein
MPRSAGALAVTLATAAFALGLVAPSPVEAQNAVTVDVTCPSEQNPQLVVRVDPWVYEVDLNGPGEWNLNIEDDIEIAAKQSGKWFWKKEKVKDKKKVKLTEWKDKEFKSGDYFDYNITVHCGASSAVIDPRVRVR